jgi:hypothetical protein
MEPGLGGPRTPNIWQHTDLRNFIIQRKTTQIHMKRFQNFKSILCASVNLQHKVFNLSISIPSYLSLIWLYIMMIFTAIIMHLTNVSVPLCQTTQHHNPHSPQPQISQVTSLPPTTVKIWCTQRLYEIYSVILWMHMVAIGVRRTCKHFGRVFGSSVTAFNFCYYVCCNCHQNSNHTPGTVRLKRDGPCAETRFCLSEKRTSPFESAGVSA